MQYLILLQESLPWEDVNNVDSLLLRSQWQTKNNPTKFQPGESMSLLFTKNMGDPKVSLLKSSHQAWMMFP